MRAKVSVIIPIYNAELYLEQCIDSLLNQSLKDIEIICVDDGSSDRTHLLLEQYKNEDSRIKVLYQSNQYAGVARNNGMASATGKYLIFLDSDDYFEADFLEKMYSKSERNSTDLCICDGKIYDEMSAKITKGGFLKGKFLPQKEIFSYKDIPDSIFQIKNPAPWNMLCRKDFITSNGLLFENSRFGNDVLFFGKAIVLAKRISYIDEPLLTYRRGAIGNLQSKKDANPTSILGSLNQIKSFLIKENLYNAVRKSWLQFVVNNIIFNLNTLKTYEAFEKLYNACFTSEHAVENLLKINECDLHDSLSYKQLEAYRSKSLEEFKKERFASIDLHQYIVKGTHLPNRKVSVIIPVYNTMEYVGECIESALKQTLTDIEIIIVNDGSTDGSGHLIEDYAKADNRIIYVNKANGGPSIARNIGLEIARGEYILFLDSDDFITENTLEELYQKACQESLDILFFNTIAYTEDSDLEEHVQNFNDHYKRTCRFSLPLTGSSMFMRMVQTDCFLESVCLQFFRKDFLVSINLTFYEGILHEDNLFSCVALLIAEKVSYINKAFHIRRVRQNSIMTSPLSVPNFVGYFITYTELIKLLPSLKLNEIELACFKKYLQQRYYKADHIFDKLSNRERKRIDFSSNEVARILYNNYLQLKTESMKSLKTNVSPIRKLWRKIVPKSIRSKLR